jgi:hypothetical protein
MQRRICPRLRYESLEGRCMLAATVAFERDNVAYLIDESRPEFLGFQRYDLDTKEWLGPLPLSGASGLPLTSLLDDDGIYVAEGNAIYRYGFDGGGKTLLFNSPGDVLSILSDGDLLFASYYENYGHYLASVNKTTGSLIDTTWREAALPIAFSVASEINRILCQRYSSPPDISSISYDDEGTFLDHDTSPYHSLNSSGASRTWVFPGGTKVVNDAGSLYSTENLSWLNDFETHFTDIDFLGHDVPIVLNGNKLTAYSAGILPMASKT